MCVNKKFTEVSSITCLLNSCSSWLECLLGTEIINFSLREEVNSTSVKKKKGSPGKKSLGLNNYIVNKLFLTE